MLYGYHTKDTRTERERHLEDELESLRHRQQQEQERAYRERETRRREINHLYETNLRSADTWPEALARQAYLCERESRYDDPPIDFFAESVAACNYALQIWPDAEAKVSAEIEELESRIQQLRDSVRHSVGTLVSQHENGQSDGWKDVANTLSDPDADIEAWLNW